MPRQTNTRATPRADLGAAIMDHPFIPPGLIGPRILPPLKVMKREASISALTRAGLTRRRDVRRGLRSAASRDSFEHEDRSYKCHEYVHEAQLDDAERAIYRSDFDAEMASTAYAQGVLLREQEIRIATEIFNADSSHWYSSTAALYTDNSSAPWDAAASDVIAQVNAAKEIVRQNTGMYPNTIVFGAATLANLLSNTGILAKFPGIAVLTQDALIGNLPGIFGIPNVLVGGAAYNSSNEGLTASMSDIWSVDYAWLGVCAQTENPIEPCVGRSVLWIEESPENVMVSEYREEQTESMIYKVKQWVDEFISDVYFGHLMKIDA